jgi:hypothetical protein
MKRSETCNLKPNETHLGSLCVAIVFGELGGLIGIKGMSLLTLDISLWWTGLVCVLLGYILPWLVCRYLFVTAHNWYGHRSVAHRIYDTVVILSALVIFYFMTG